MHRERSGCPFIYNELAKYNPEDRHYQYRQQERIQHICRVWYVGQSSCPGPHTRNGLSSSQVAAALLGGGLEVTNLTYVLQEQLQPQTWRALAQLLPQVGWWGGGWGTLGQPGPLDPQGAGGVPASCG